MGLLEELAVRCEAATGNVRDTDMEWDIHFACGRTEPEPLAYTASMDAATVLIPEGWAWGIASDLTDPGIHVGMQRRAPYASAESSAATPALALTAASLRARAALEIANG